MSDFPEQIDDMQDRLLDRALCELLSEESPPDLSRRILAVSQQDEGTAEVSPRSKPARPAPRLWFLGLAVVASLAMIVHWGIPSLQSPVDVPTVVALADQEDALWVEPTAAKDRDVVIRESVFAEPDTPNASVTEITDALSREAAEPTSSSGDTRKMWMDDGRGVADEIHLPLMKRRLAGPGEVDRSANGVAGRGYNDRSAGPTADDGVQWHFTDPKSGNTVLENEEDRYGRVSGRAKGILRGGEDGGAHSPQPAAPVDNFGLTPADEIAGAVPLPTITSLSAGRPANGVNKVLGRSDVELAAGEGVVTREARRAGVAVPGLGDASHVMSGGVEAVRASEAVPAPSVALRRLQKKIAATSQQVTEAAQQLGQVQPAEQTEQKVRMERLARQLGQLQGEYETLEEQGAARGRGAEQSGDQYTRIDENPFIATQGAAAVSTFSIDVDTASYTNTRQYLLAEGTLPPPDAVRIEEFVNYFDYDYLPPRDDTPFASSIEVAGCPWQPKHRLVRIGIKGEVMDRNERPSSNLVFLIDVSGSMNDPKKLPLVIAGLRELTQELGESDRVAIAVYANQEGLVLPSTRGDQKDAILAALGQLKAGGSTAGGAGIQLAYRVAEENFISGGTNRVILCTDGDFNVGVTNTAALERLAEQKAQSGVFLTVLGFGRGNLNDAMMEAISNKGNGNYHYVDAETEARKVLVRQMSGTLVTIAKDVKIQIEFNPARVAGYRLLGYENRLLAREDFNDDTKDAGEIGAGHTVTALYEVVPAGTAVAVGLVEPLKYQQAAGEPNDAAEFEDELLELRIRYKQPEANTSQLLKFPVIDESKGFASASEDFRFAASVVGFGLLLRDSQYKGDANVDAILEIATSSAQHDEFGYRREFVTMIQRAKTLGLQ